jgi:hypothetical protein
MLYRSFHGLNIVYRLEILSVMLVFFNRLCELAPPPLPPIPCVNKDTVYNASQKVKTPAAKSLYRKIFLDDAIWNFILSVI